MMNMTRKSIAVLGIAILAAGAMSGAPASAQNGPKAIVQVVEYSAGPNWQAGLPPEKQDLAGHFQMVAAKFAEGTLLANGPTLDDFYGLYIYNTGSQGATRAIMDADQALTSGVLAEVKVETWRLFMENLGADIGDNMLFVLNYHPGPAWAHGKSLFEQDIAAHLNHVGGLLKAGTLLAGGPVSDTHGRYIVAAANTAAVYTIIGQDPAVRANTFVVQVKPWAPFNRQGLK